jgi:hypothetical protein
MAISSPSPNGSGREISPFPLRTPSEAKINTITKTNSKIPPTTDRVDRTSFSSIKESHSGGVAQTFTDSKTSSYLRNQFTSSNDGLDEDAILDDAASSSSGTKTPEAKPGMITNPHSVLHGFVCPCDSFKGWKSISIKGRMASKSYSDLKGLGMRFDWETRGGDKMNLDGEGKTKKIVKVKGRYPVGQSPFERLPMELLGKFSIPQFVAQEGLSGSNPVTLRSHDLQRLPRIYTDILQERSLTNSQRTSHRMASHHATSISCPSCSPHVASTPPPSQLSTAKSPSRTPASSANSFPTSTITLP